MAMETAATYALRLCQEMADTQKPNPGNYGPAGQGPYSFIGITNAGLIAGWWQYCQWTNYSTMPSWDATNTPGSTTGLPHPYATAASILCIEFLIQSGQMTLAKIADAIEADPYLVLNDHYNGVGDLQTDAVNAMLALGIPTNNDPLGIFGVNWDTQA